MPLYNGLARTESVLAYGQRGWRSCLPHVGRRQRPRQSTGYNFICYLIVNETDFNSNLLCECDLYFTN